MKIQENKIQEHNGTSFSITKVDGVSMLQFDEKSIISNIEDYATIILGDCTNCEKIKDLYKEHTKIPKKEMDSILKHDIWWEAEKCLEYGLVDELI